MIIKLESLKKLSSSHDDKRGGLCMVFLATVIIALVLLLYVCFVVELFPVDAAGIKRLVFSKENCTPTCASARKLLQSDDDDGGTGGDSIDGGGTGGGDANDGGGGGSGDANRIGTACSKDDIAIFQGSTAPLPNGIPAYTVQILNVCVSGCSISNIHVSCGWFSSVRLINPTVFRRLYYDDCLVNDGEALGPGQTLSFQYANSFQYPLSVSSVTCC
ncbi:hypothetical protein ACOSQ3_016024 [Xanthoceras sorbifolium]